MSGSSGSIQHVTLTGHIAKEGQVTSTAVKVKVTLLYLDGTNPTVLESSYQEIEVYGHAKYRGRWRSPEDFAVIPDRIAHAAADGNWIQKK